ncbi:MAG: bifunctional DNA-formamidopyrimidine glycosylase/DNA-(apurinic or apyrimidinic site) lyase [Calditrichaeota bacterium]|nr:bifunctional DNA-formamidopyrimidine glycosylase/DNA-(apurinic or apyrimidinic site) lyase [Calditrichota bacterium]
MPELPEVETVIRELKPVITGKEIDSVTPVWFKTLVNRSERLLRGQRIEAVERIGKYIILRLSRSFLIIHLRMTGRLHFDPGNADLQVKEQGLNHLRLIVNFTDGSKLLFNDTRKFGRFYHVDDPHLVLQNVGDDALDPRLTAGRFYEMLKNRKIGVKAFLLSQRWIAGLGNIYADESLFRAGIHPERKCNTIDLVKAKELWDAVQFILRQAVENMGSTISDYRDAYGNPGKNQLYFKVYRRAGEPCFKCGTAIKKIRAAGRGTHFCPVCQT